MNALVLEGSPGPVPAQPQAKSQRACTHLDRPALLTGWATQGMPRLEDPLAAWVRARRPLCCLHRHAARVTPLCAVHCTGGAVAQGAALAWPAASWTPTGRCPGIHV
eukprot:1158419-Pelagomonas_calceolata.AAC.2